MEHIKASNPDLLIAWTTGTSFGTLLHGIYDAGFSAVDDTDDDDTKLAIVVGNCDRANPTIAARLCLQGTHHDFSEWVEQLLYTGHQVVA